MCRWKLAPLLSLSLFLGCGQPPNPQGLADPAQSRQPSIATSQAGDEETLPKEPLASQAKIEPLKVAFDKYPLPPAEFKKGEVSPREPDSVKVDTTDNGFVITMPSGTPVPTPTIFKDRLYASGGFSSKEYYCVDAKTGQFVWGAQLSDDGPSIAATTDDSIIFNTESCTIFALELVTGKCRWSHYMGDPMMAAPAVAGDKVFTVYPASPDNVKPEVEPMPLPKPMPDREEMVANEPLTQPTYVLACLNAKTGKVLWQHWLDALGHQQQKAADNLGLGNVSTLQAYQGSRILNTGDRNFNCMGDEVLCTSAKTGKKLWSVKLEGDLSLRACAPTGPNSLEKCSTRTRTG
jgi:outer membrane protein assembly factor BamB